MQCPVCRGTGTKKIRVKAKFAGGWDKKRTRYLECIWCDGRGKVSYEEHKILMSVINAPEVRENA